MAPEFRDLCSAATLGASFGNPRYFAGKMKAFTWSSWHLTLPFFSSFLEQTPSWLGLAERLPAGVARQWARWGRSSDWCFSELPFAREIYDRFTAPLLALRATDDPIAPLEAERAYIECFSRQVPRTHHYQPSEFNRAHIGHGGLLKRWALPSVGPRLLEHFACHSRLEDSVR